MKTRLFDPIRMRDVEIPNRIVVSPMCQYSAHNGVGDDWHLVNLGQYALSGVGLAFVEATAVEPVGRITHGCLGLWDDETEAAIAPIVAFFRNHGTARIGMQLGHAGRKASVNEPWGGSGPLGPDQNPWQTVAPSAIPHASHWHTPTALGDNALADLTAAFVQATERSARLDFDVLELHAAHGYLVHQFLSPLCNQRDDKYGGSLENRMRYPLELFDAVRAAWPDNKPLGVRVSATDYVERSSWHLDETIAFAEALKERGCDFIDVSSGGIAPEQEIVSAPGYQTGMAAEIKRATGLTTLAVGRITSPEQAESILVTGQADMVLLARGITYDPRWAWHAAVTLGDERVQYPHQYARSHPSLHWVPARSSPQHNPDKPGG